MKKNYFLVLIFLFSTYSFFAQSCDELTTNFSAGNQFAGNMFDVNVSGNDDLEIDGFEVNLASGTATISVYYKTGSYIGSESNMSDWTLLGTDTVTGLGQGTPTPVNITGLTMTVGSSYGFYVTNSSYSTQTVSVYYTNGSNTFTNADLTIVSGIGRGNPDFTGATNPDRIWNGTIEYCYGCGAPSNINVASVTDNSADFSWTAAPKETNGYSWVIMNAGDDPNNDTPAQSGTTATGVTTITVNNLNPETDYDFYIMTDCGAEGVSNFSSMLNFMTITSCLAPSNLNLDGVSDTTADVSWMVSPDETNGYNWFVFNSGDNPDTDTPVQNGSTTIGVSTLNITGLSSITPYDFYVQADCDIDGQSRFEGPLSFTTNCAPYMAPFFEDFENGSNSINCWTQVNEVGSSDWTYAEGSTSGSINTAVSGIQNIVFVSESSIGEPITKYVSPILDLTSVTNPKLRFYFAQENYVGDYNTLKVYYRSSSQDPWVELNHYNQNQDTWQQVELALPNPSSTYQIAFEGINNFGRPNVIDDVEVYDNLSIASQSFEEFTFYPNPTKNTITFSAKSNIQTLKVYDILGKEVATATPHNLEFTMSFSNLTQGVYFVKATINDQVKSFKIIKE